MNQPITVTVKINEPVKNRYRNCQTSVGNAQISK